MASTQVNTYDTVGNREGLTDRVADLFAQEVPLLAMTRKVRAIATKHEWQADNLSAASTTGKVEGFTVTYAQPAARARHANYTQIMARTWDVTHTQQNVRVAGIANEAARQLLKAMKELATDYEKIFLNSGNSGAGSTAAGRSARGLQNAIITNTAVGTGTGNSALIDFTEGSLNNLMAKVWNAGGDPKLVICNEYQKRVISQSFTAKTGFSFNIDASTRKAINNINQYEGSFGTVQIIPDRFHMNQRVTILSPEQLKIAVLEDIKSFKGAKVSSSDRGWVEAEMTIEWGNEKGHAKASFLATSGVSGVD